MSFLKWLGAVAAIVLIVACFYPWVYIESINKFVYGTSAEVIRLGKPAYFHFILLTSFLILNFIPRVWAKRVNLFVVALNMGWALRNYFLITTCQAGECPVKQTAVYLLIPASAIVMITAFFPHIKIRDSFANNSVIKKI